MLNLKQVLNDLVDYTYLGHPKHALFKKFYVECVDKNMKSYHGVYNIRTHHIKVVNLYRDDASIVATTIHELAHHVDNMLRGDTDHSKEFYEAFKTLLYGALDMKLFSKEQFLSATKDASDSNKITKMIADYTAKDVNYKKDMLLITVTGGYEQREQLKARRYFWNNVNKVWEKEIAGSDKEAEERFLSRIGLKYVTKEPSLTFASKHTAQYRR